MTDSQIWKKIKEWLLSTDLVEPTVYNDYLKNASLQTINSGSMAIILPSSFAKDILKEIMEPLNKQINELVGEEIMLSYLTKSEFDQEKKISDTLKKKSNNRNNNLHTFDNFILGDSNSEAYNASQAIINNLGRKFNPFFVYGDSGLGKTHLIKAIQNKINTDEPNLIIKYYVANDFRKEIIDSIQAGFSEVETLKEKILSYDVLLIDDIQFLANADKTNEIFFNIFNEFIEKEKQIILTSDKFPEQLNGFDKRLVSRFGQGLSVRIQKPDFKTSLNIVSFKLENNNILVSDEIKNYIATYYGNDIRKVEGIVNKFEFWCIQNNNVNNKNKVIEMEEISSLFEDYSINTNGNVTVSHIKEFVANSYGVSVAMIDGKSRIQNIVKARHVSMYLTGSILKYNYSEIAQAFGGKDHTTVLNAFKKIDKMLTTDKQFKKFINQAMKKLSSKN